MTKDKISDQMLLDNLPNETEIEQAVEELFIRAKETNLDSFVPSILDISSFKGKDGKERLFLERTRHVIISQFLYNFQAIAEIPDSEIENELNFIFFRRLQLLGYSQFWECTGIQRLLYNLSKVINGKEYDLNYLLDTKYIPVFNIINDIKGEANINNLSICKIIESLYFNKIRNAFAHSDFMVDKNAIILMYGKPKKDLPFFTIKSGTWDLFYKAFIIFIKAIAKNRAHQEKYLIENCPINIQLPGFKNHTIINTTGRWRFKQ